MQEALSLQARKKPANLLAFKLVAEAGFEPTTFGL
jgi:hypothetical protein